MATKKKKHPMRARVRGPRYSPEQLRLAQRELVETMAKALNEVRAALGRFDERTERTIGVMERSAQALERIAEKLGR
jgi:hypothetical protein